VCGAILGSLAAGFVLLPAFGSRGSLLLLSGLTALGAALLAALVAPRARRGAVLGAGVLATALAALTVPDPFAFSLDRLHPGERELWRREGVQTTVSVHERGRGRDQHRVMYLDGRHQANDTRNTLFVHRRIGLLPMAIHPDPKQALVIGLGGGATPGGVALFPRTQVTVVELSRTVVDGAEWFRHANFDLLRRPNVSLRIDDGRNHLLLTRQKYDVITADIMLPVHAGATSLYSREYFRLVQRALDYHGVVLQWIGSSSEAEYKLILRTFMSVFRNTTLWADGSLLVGTRHPLVLEREAFARKLADPDMAKALEAIGLHSFDRLLSLFVAGPDELRAFAGPGPVLTDDRPTVEYFLTLPREPEVDLSRLKGDVTPYVR
jgi:spermidine synthase